MTPRVLVFDDSALGLGEPRPSAQEGSPASVLPDPISRHLWVSGVYNNIPDLSSSLTSRDMIHDGVMRLKNAPFQSVIPGLAILNHRLSIQRAGRRPA